MKIAVVMGSKSDLNKVEPAINILKEYGVETIVRCLSAHRAHKELGNFIEECNQNGTEVIIAAAGMAAALPGVIAAQTVIPVIGVPISGSNLEGMDALLSIVQMPSGIPVATVAIDGSKNAAYLALEILGIKYPKLRSKLVSLRENIEADAVAGVPDSGIAHAIGYANESGIPFSRPLVKYTPTWPRSFTPSSQSQRNLIAKMKLIAINDLIKNKRLVLIDDSIVRGTQLRETVEYLYDAGVKEVHVRPACPPILYPCKYLNFTRSTSALDLITRRVIANLEGTTDISDDVVQEYVNPDSPKYKAMIEEIRKEMNFDSLQYHRIDDLIESIGLDECKLCTYCFNGKED